MVSKTSSVRSVRLANDAWEWLAVEAAARQTNLNAVIADLVNEGRQPRRRPEPRAVTKPKAAAPEPTSRVHVEVPTYERKPFNPQPKTGKPKGK